jgi:PAS domain S-box-containing protein
MARSFSFSWFKSIYSRWIFPALGKVFHPPLLLNFGTSSSWEQRHPDRRQSDRRYTDRRRRDRRQRQRRDDSAQLAPDEPRFRTIFDGSFQFIGLLTLDGTVVEVNQPALDFIGLPLTAVIGQPFWLTPWWTHSNALQAQLKKAIALAAKGELVRFEACHYDPNGQPLFVDFSLKPVFDPTGTVVMLIPEGRDITERKHMEEERRRAEVALQQLNEELELRVQDRTQEIIAIAARQNQLYQQLQKELAERQQAEEALRQKEQFLRLALAGAQAGTWDWQIPTGEVFWSSENYNLYGKEPTGQPLRYSDWEEAVYPDDREQVTAALQQCFQAGQTEFRNEFRIAHPQRGLRWLMVLGRITFDELGQPVRISGINLDITEQRQMEQMKSEFIALVSHELRTPLTGIRGSLGLLNAGLLDDGEETRNMLQVAHREVERLTRLVNDILDLERLEYTKDLHRQWCQAETLMQQSCNAMQTLADEHQIQLVYAPTPLSLWVDCDRITQVLINLVNNAIKFSPPQTQVHLSAQLRGDRVLFQVTDQGRGIPSDKLEAVFDRFQQLDASNSRTKDGTGLGLAISRNIVKKHGGRIWVESVVGEGSIFSFTLPISQENEVPLA